MVVLRREIGDVLRDQRRRQGRTLREVSSTARVSLGYLSEVERGQKEASSELLASICSALDLPLSLVLHEVTQRVADAESARAPYAAEGVVPVTSEAAAAVADPAVVASGGASDDVSGVVPDVLPDELVAELMPAGLPADVLDALVEVLPELDPHELSRALECRRRRRLVSVA
ncbi:helix-turn-helix protein [Kineococcus xinjiangensis]|uniref:Helix-turn-helix protein n=1 Tax=Kineococcus xinjiangensis TaxID=512762 RepID=A0A2S6IW07_9ACTN|nr:helix-turn-helix transcriptional regulator [Kineococcus xinjiangensis]PPK98475.1 helix-turn-helix protein [Kineococcus xinjiangensis]